MISTAFVHVRRGLTVAMAMLLTACGLFLSEEDQLKRALDARVQGDFRAAFIDLKNLLEKNPQHREARFNLGLVMLDMGDAIAAARDLERAQQEGIAIERIVEPLSRAYLVQGEVDKALKLVDAELAKISVDPNAALQATRLNLLLIRGQIALAKRDWSAARQAYEAALALEPQNVRALLGMVSVVDGTEGAQAALAVADRAIAAGPNEPSAYLARAALYMRLRDTAAAATAFQQAGELATAPAQRNELLTALGGLTQAQLLLEQKDEALKTSARMMELAPNARLSRYARGQALVQTGDLDAARELFEQNLAGGEDLLSRLMLGAIDLQQGKLAQAEMHLSSVVASAPDNVEARQLLAQARLRQAKPSEALDTILPAVADDKGSSIELLALAAQASLAAGKTKEGVALLKRSAEQHPQNTRAQLDLAAGYLAAGQADQALAVLGGVEREADPRGPASATERLRREYLNVLARLQKGDVKGAIAAATTAARAAPDDAALQSLASAVLITQRRFNEARSFAESAIRLQPNDAGAYMNLGRLELLEGNIEAARQQFRTALDKRPGDPSAATSLALVEISAQQPDAALAVLSAARKHNPASLEPRLLEVQLLLARGQLDDAERLAREAVELDDGVSSLTALGRVLSTRGQHNEALTLFERAVRKQPKSVATHYQLAVAQRLAGRFAEGLKSTSEALKLEPRHLPALQLDGVLSIATGDLTRAAKQAEVLARLAPDQAGTYELIGMLRRAQQRYADAAAAFRKAGELAPRPAYAVAEFEARMLGKLPEPEAPLEKYLSAHPADPTTRLAWAQAQQERGDRAAAMRSYEMVLSNDPKNVVALNNLAWLKHQAGASDAVELARRAHALAPTQPAIIDTYAWILVRTGKVNEGLKLFDDLFALGARDKVKGLPPEVSAHYAYALAQGGRNAEAKKLAQELVATTPNLNDELHKLLADLLKT